MGVPPRHVVRFYGNTDYAMQTIGFKEITFVHQAQLNDPFDPPIYLTTDFNDDYQAFINYVKKNYNKDLHKFLSRMPQENWNNYLDQIAKIFDSIRNKIYIFSTCAVSAQNHPKDNLYMWSHYGNGHRGVAIEFDTALLTKAVSMEYKKSTGEEAQSNEVWSEINYTPSIPKLTCESIYEAIMSAPEKLDMVTWQRPKFDQIMLLMLRSKSIVWKEEAEWRLMWHNDETNLKIQRLNLPDNTITALYLGCLTTDHSNLLSQLKLSFPNAVVFMGKKAKGEFALEFEELK